MAYITVRQALEITRRDSHDDNLKLKIKFECEPAIYDMFWRDLKKIINTWTLNILYIYVRDGSFVYELIIDDDDKKREIKKAVFVGGRGD